MDLRGFVEVTEVSLKLLAQKAYQMSVPVGLGFIHARDGGLDDETADALIERGAKLCGGIDMDYVHGRQCKFNVRAIDGKRYVKIDWYDHSIEAMKKLLRECEVPDVEARIAAAEASDEERRKEYEEENARHRSQR